LQITSRETHALKGKGPQLLFGIRPELGCRFPLNDRHVVQVIYSHLVSLYVRESILPGSRPTELIRRFTVKMVPAPDCNQGDTFLGSLFGKAETVKALGFAPMSACADLTISFIES